MTVRGYRDAMSFVLRRADDAAFRWDRELVVGLHDRILAGDGAAGAGRFRTGPAYVVDHRAGQLVFQPPPAGEVPALVDAACSVIEQGREHPAIAAAWIHVAVAAIHPFQDGNGRASRVLASLAMYRGGFKLPEFTSLEEWWGRHLSDYYAAFRCLGEAFDHDTDVTPFVRAHMEAQLHQVRALDLRERVQHRIWTAVEEAVTAAGLAVLLATVLLGLLGMQLSRTAPRRGKNARFGAAVLVYAAYYNAKVLAKTLVGNGTVGLVPGILWVDALLAALVAAMLWRQLRGTQWEQP